MNPDSLDLEVAANLASHLYVIFAFVMAVLFSRQVEKKWFAFLVVFWIIAQPVLNAFYIIKLSWLPFDFQPNRILFLFLISYFALKITGSNRGLSYNKQHKADFMPYLAAYIVFVVIAMLVNMNTLTVKRLIGIPLEPLTFFLLFIFVKDIITEKLMRSFLYAIVLMAVINALIALYQIGFDVFFLRTANPRIAFGGVYRSYGVFPTEYVLGSMQVISVFIVATFIKRNAIKYSMILLLLGSIMTTFHRLDLLIVMICGLVYLSKYAKKRIAAPVLVLLALCAVATIPAYSVFKSIGGESQLISERLADDTITGRFQQFSLVIKNMPGHPLGLGSYDHPVYQKLMIDNGMTKSVLQPDGQRKAVGLGVHNGFLGVGIQYGILAMIMFAIVLWKMFHYFRKRATRDNPLTVIPLFSVSVWVLSNMSNGIIVFSSYNVMLIALIAGAFVGLFEKGIYLNESQDTEEEKPLEKDDCYGVKLR